MGIKPIFSANLFRGKNFVSALPLSFACLTEVIQTGVNDAKGLPVMMVTGELTEKLQKAIVEYIIPVLQKTYCFRQQRLQKNQI